MVLELLLYLGVTTALLFIFHELWDFVDWIRHNEWATKQIKKIMEDICSLR